MGDTERMAQMAEAVVSEHELRDTRGARVRKVVVGDSWIRAAVILLMGLTGGSASTGLLANAQPRSDTEIREIAKEVVADERRVTDTEFEHLKDQVQETRDAVGKVDGKVDDLRDLIIERLPRS